ncbi:hypothetical protein BASA61_009567 [Batrachochytrium salamandrivorans]|nr:hypothetical protein BASA60_008504 [Batrachochytrium salamandrivorans]KAH6580555.1 hypothetical protein BASA61_009567 [Batrachochytrium salamandrivorans]KAH9252726.1 hypothetical protein BASA81_009329 [Batrachochytrium salamandrivorans]KAH9274054.1 hypothetical protein BASA83_003696 [Batrachochytrium salamandrivorans]
MEQSKADGPSEQAFKRFQTYPFAQDQRFTLGLQELLKGPDSFDTSKMEQAKAFYFSKFIMNMDYSAYKQWASSHGPQEQETRDVSVVASTEETTSPAVVEDALMKESDISCVASDPSTHMSLNIHRDAVDEKAHNCNEIEHARQYPSLSFQEIADRVARGEPIPGIRQIPSTVHDHRSTPTLIPLRKPWETETMVNGMKEEEKED